MFLGSGFQSQCTGWEFKLSCRIMKYILLVLTALIFASLPLFKPGFLPTHDGEYHIIRFFEFEKMFKAGFLFPRWAPGLNSGYGVPLFNFFYPLPNYVGSLFHILGWSLTDSFKLSLATAYIGAGIFCFFWLKRLFNVKAATVGAIIFAYIPYWFVDIYVRGSIGEVFAICFLMLFLVCIENNRRLFGSFAVAGIILSHNILSILFLPLVVVYALLKKRQYILNIFLGIGLSAYFWLPALLERKFVVGLTAVNVLDYFPDLYQILIPSWGTGFSASGLTGNEMSPQIGILPILVIFLSLWVVIRSKEKSGSKLAIFFLILVLLSFIMMLSISYPIWKTVSVLSYLQYPWRLLSVFLPSIAFLTAFTASRINKIWFQVLLVLCAIIASYQYARPAVYLPRSDEYYLTRREFTDGTSSLGNSFSTQWSAWKENRAKEKIEVTSGFARLSEVILRPASYYFKTSSDSTATIAIHTLYYPGWVVKIDNQITQINYKDNGIINVVLPSGSHSVSIYFTETPTRIFADFISLFSLFWIVGSAILKRHAYRNRHHIDTESS